jgi:hypothetical protein
MSALVAVEQMIGLGGARVPEGTVMLAMHPASAEDERSPAGDG